jgi:hypothetical protein
MWASMVVVSVGATIDAHLAVEGTAGANSE